MAAAASLTVGRLPLGEAVWVSPMGTAIVRKSRKIEAQIQLVQLAITYIRIRRRLTLAVPAGISIVCVRGGEMLMEPIWDGVTPLMRIDARGHSALGLRVFVMDDFRSQTKLFLCRLGLA